MMRGEIIVSDQETVICQSSWWLYADRGGLLLVHPKLIKIMVKGALLATQYDIFGDLIKQYFAPDKGIIIGKSVSPVNQSGGRMLHLGKIKI